ncbi:MAG: DNA repair protein RecN [Candidatus Dormibacteraceae bacterium]
MLSRLKVRDLALVECCELVLGPGLTLLTGETGSGKSLLIDALGLALGARAQSGQVRKGARQAEVEAKFEEAAGELVLRRTIGARGGAALDGVPVAVGELAEQARARVVVHGQHDQQALADPGAQARLLDALSGALPERERVASAHAAWEAARAGLTALRRVEAEAAEQQDFDRWRLRQLREADPQPDEDERLREERTVLRNVTRLGAAMATAQEGLRGDEGLVQSALAVGAAADLDPRLRELAGRLEVLAEEARDLAAEVRRYGDGLEADPAHLEEVEARLALLEGLKRRHGGTLDSVIAERARLEAGLGDGEDRVRDLAAAAAAEEAARETLRGTAQALTRRRMRGARTFAARVESELHALGLPDARLQARLQPRDEPGPDGAEGVELWFAANPGEGAAPLAHVASGGELSRVMLAIETATAEASDPGTLVFDEVDAGIGGRTALEVGRRLRRLARTRQVLVVTHLAQVAAFADHQLRVDKVRRSGRTAVQVEVLRTPGQRAEELARMMSGALTEKAMARAEELLESAQVDASPRQPPGRGEIGAPAGLVA